MNRGEIWRYAPVVARSDEPDLRVIVSTNAINNAADVSAVLAVRIVSTDPGGILAVRIGSHGWALAPTVQPLIRSRFPELVDQVDVESMEHLDAALRAALDL